MASASPAPSPPAAAAGAPTDVGIIAMCAYVPRTAVSQAALETFDGVSTGKYTIGLGQTHMSFITDREDVVSLALTAVSRLLSETGTSPADVGRLEVGTETILDKSKSVKTALMRLFGDNHEIEGLDNTNACYGGTAALFNTAAWTESSAWDGRLGIVVCADVAVYAPGAARATGGAGSVAMLVGRGEAVRVKFEVGLRATHMEDTHDFFKPDFGTEYPTVDGKATVKCFMRAIDRTYARFRERAAKADGCPLSVRDDSVAYCLLHAPFNKLVRKSMARLLWADFVSQNASGEEMDPFFDPVAHHAGRQPDVCDREATKAFVDLSEGLYEEKCAPAAWLARESGNSYTASLYGSLAALFEEEGERANGKRILMFSFGSGFAASMFSLRVVRGGGVVRPGRIRRQLKMREVVEPEEYHRWMEVRERDYNRFGYSPGHDPNKLGKGVYYLESVESNGARMYAKTPESEEDAEAEEVAVGNKSKTTQVCNGAQVASVRR